MHRKVGVAPRKCETERLEWHPENEKKIIVINTAKKKSLSSTRLQPSRATAIEETTNTEQVKYRKKKTSIMHYCGFIKPTRFPCPLTTENF